MSATGATRNEVIDKWISNTMGLRIDTNSMPTADHSGGGEDERCCTHEASATARSHTPSNLFPAAAITIDLRVSTGRTRLSDRKVLRTPSEIAHDALVAWATQLWQQQSPEAEYHCAYLHITVGFDGNRPWEMFEQVAFGQRDVRIVIDTLHRWAQNHRQGLFLNIDATMKAGPYIPSEVY